MFILSRTFLTGLFYFLLATALRMAVPPRLTETEWLTVFLSSLVSFISGEAIVQYRKNKRAELYQLPVKRQTWKDKLKNLWTEQFLITILAFLVITLFLYVNKISSTTWISGCSAVIAAFVVGNSSLKEIKLINE